MPRAFGFSFRTSRGVAAFLVALVVFLLVYHQLLQRSVDRHPEALRQAVGEHCRFVVGQRLREGAARGEFEEARRGCGAFRVRAASVRGGTFDPVIVKIDVDRESGFPLDADTYVFRSDLVGFTVLPGLAGIFAGRWRFNPYVVYSEALHGQSF